MLAPERVLDRLIAEGVVTPARQAKRRAGPPIKAKGTVSDLVVSARLVYPEGRTTLAQARRLGRLTVRRLAVTGVTQHA